MVPAVPSPSTAAQTSVLVARQLATAPGAPEVADATTAAVGSRVLSRSRAAPTASRRQLRSFSFMVVPPLSFFLDVSQIDRASGGTANRDPSPTRALRDAWCHPSNSPWQVSSTVIEPPYLLQRLNRASRCTQRCRASRLAGTRSRGESRHSGPRQRVQRVLTPDLQRARHRATVHLGDLEEIGRASCRE